MAITQTRTYTYTGQSGWKANVFSLKLSDFAMTGSDMNIANITSINVTWKSWQRTSSTIVYTSKLTIGSTVYTSSSYSYRGDEETTWVNVYFSSFPAATEWAESNITLSSTLNTKYTDVYWKSPITVTLTYEPINFSPWIQNVRMYRADETGVAKDSGENLSFSCTVGVNNTGTDGSGVVTITNGSTTIATIDQIAGSTTGTMVSAIPLSSVTQETGDDITYTVTFAYTATQDGSVQTDSISTTVYVGEVFTNVHLAGVKTGGVRFGGYSTATLDNPKFECNYPAYFYGGIAYGGLDYSLDEIDTGVKWVDGKTIYRKVIVIDSPAAKGNQYIDINASGTIDKLIKIWGVGVSSTGAYPMPTVATSNDYNVVFEGNGNPVTKILFRQGDSRGITWAFGVVEYTLVEETT